MSLTSFDPQGPNNDVITGSLRSTRALKYKRHAPLERDGDGLGLAHGASVVAEFRHIVDQLLSRFGQPVGRHQRTNVRDADPVITRIELAGLFQHLAALGGVA